MRENQAVGLSGTEVLTKKKIAAIYLATLEIINMFRGIEFYNNMLCYVI